MMDLVFCGTPQFAVPTLQRLVTAGFRVKLVATQPDRPRGRGMEVATSPVKREALRMELPIAQPETIKNNQEFRAQLEAIQPLAIIVVGYGRSTCRRSATSTCTHRCCQNIAVLRRFSGRSLPARAWLA